MNRRNPAAALAASPTMVGAVTTLIVIVAVFLAYNANNGLPFVPVYRVSVEVPNAARIGNNNEIRIGGTRVGIVEAIEPVVNESAQTTAQTGGDGNEGELPQVSARLNLKLDKTAAPLPQDSVFRVRYRSTFGLKYLEIVRGTGPDAPEGFVFDGLNDIQANPDFVGCDVPVDPETFSETIPAQAKDGCFTPQTEFDAIANTFDTKTREAGRRNLAGFGNAFAGRGMSLNDAIESLNPLFQNLGPVSKVLADPATGLRRLFAELADTARIVAPVSEQQAQFFTNAAIAFTAISSDPAALQETISEGPETLRVMIDTLPRQRPFLAELAELSRRLRPGVQQLRIALPSLNSAVQVGTPVLRQMPALNRDLRKTLIELRRLVDQSTTKLSLVRLDETFDQAKPLLRWVVPSQTVCNYFNYWFTFLPSAFDRDQVGFNFRQALTSAPPGPNALQLGPLTVTVPGEVETPIAGYSGNAANGKAGPILDPPTGGEFRPLEIPDPDGPMGPKRAVDGLPILHVPINTPAGQNGDADCQQGQVGYPIGASPDVRFPGQPASNPALALMDIPGSRGPTTLFWDAEGNRDFIDTRVAGRQP
jgi:ABC-type transporter Mla subunit MlaD